jgi:hypothetical protein
MNNSKRTPLNRHRKPLFDDETLRLFVELENTPKRGRYPSDDRAWWAKDKELHRRLGLSSEWFCSCCGVTDRRKAHHSPDSPQAADFERVRAVRETLLAAAVERGYLIPPKPARTSRDRPLNA